MAFILPSLIIFGLDFTLWPFVAEVDVTYPCKVVKGQLISKYAFEDILIPYPEVPAVFEKIHNFTDIKIGIVFNITYADFVVKHNQIISVYGWDKYISYREIYPTNNITNNFKSLQEKSKIPFNKMMYFDPDKKKIKAAKDLEIHAFILDVFGMTMRRLDYGLKRYETYWQKKYNLENIKKKYASKYTNEKSEQEK